MNLAHLIDRYFAVAVVGGSPKTRRLYGYVLAHFERTVGETPTVAHLTDEWIGRHADRRLNADGMARNTVAGEMRKLLALARFAARKRLLSDFPDLKEIHTPVRVPRGWTRDELTALWRACEFAVPVGDCPGPLWWRALIACLFDSGERIGAMLAVRWEWIAAATLTIPAEVRKGGRCDRAYPLAPDTLALLTAMPRGSWGPFALMFDRSTAYNRLTAILKRAGLPHDRYSKFHRLRRTTASHFAAAGGDAQRLLGHSSPQLTELYLDPRIVKAPAPPDLLFRPGA